MRELPGITIFLQAVSVDGDANRVNVPPLSTSAPNHKYSIRHGADVMSITRGVVRSWFKAHPVFHANYVDVNCCHKTTSNNSRCYVAQLQKGILWFQSLRRCIIGTLAECHEPCRIKMIARAAIVRLLVG